MPYRETVHVDAALSNLALQYANDQQFFIADRALPPVTVTKESDKYAVYTQANWFTLPQTLRGDKGKIAEVDWDVTWATYQSEEYALKDIVTDRARKNADLPLDLDIDTTEFLTHLILLDREVRVATAVFNATTFASYTSALAAADRWDAYTSADSSPLEDVKTGKLSLMKYAQKAANTIIVGYEVFEALRLHPEIKDLIKYTYGATQDKINEELLAKCFDVDNFLVGRAIYNSANEGQTMTGAYVWGKFAMVCYVETPPPRKGVTLGTTFRAQDFQVKKWRDEEAGGDWVAASLIDDEVIIAVPAGYLLSTVIS